MGQKSPIWPQFQHFWMITPVQIRTCLWNMMCTAWRVIEEVPYFFKLVKFGGVTSKKNCQFGLNLLRPSDAYICVSKLTIIVSDNGLSPGRRQVIIWTNAAILLIKTLGTNFNEILREIYTFSFKKMHLKMPSGKCWPSCLGHNVLILVLKLIRLDGATKSYRFAI